MKRFALLLLCIFPCFSQETQLGLRGEIAGTLVGDDGTPIVDGEVGLHLLPPHALGRLRQIEWTAVSGAGGAFRFEGLSEGNYRLCVQAPKSTWLNPCVWGLQPPTATLSAKEPAASVTMVLEKGVALPIRIDDPGRLLSQDEGRRPGAHLLLGVPTDALSFHPAPLISEDSNGRNYQVVVPFNSLVKIVAYSSYFRLGDAAGSPLATAAVQIPVFVQPGQTPSTVTLRVIGGSSQ